MKILESNVIASERISEWVSSLLSLTDQDFLKAISSQKEWEWEEMDDLSGLSGILNRVDSLFLPLHQSSETVSLSALLDFSCLLLSHVHNRSMYNSVDELSQLLESPSWSVVFKTLKVLKVLSSYRIKIKHQDLTHKLYVLGLGSNLNNPSPVALQDLCSSSPLSKIPFVQGEEDSKEMAEGLKFTALNRERTNLSLDILSDRPLMVACQLLALSVFLQLYPESGLIQEFCKTLPEIWLLPALSELIRTPQPVCVQESALSLIGSIIAMLDNSRHESFNSQLAVVAHDTILSWNSMLLCLLRDLTSPGKALVEDELAFAILDLAGVMSECKHRVDLSHLPAMTCSLLVLLKSVENGENSEIFILRSKNSSLPSLSLLVKAVKVLSNLVPNSLDMFKEVEGFLTCVTLTQTQLKLFTNECDSPSNPTNAQRAILIRNLLKVIRIVMGKLEIVPGVDSPESRALMDSGVVSSLKEVFLKKRYEIYEEAIIIITHLIGDNPSIISELVSNGLILTFIDSIDSFKPPVPSSSKFIEILARLLCLVGYNHDGGRAIEGNVIVSNMLVALGNIDNELITTNVATNIGECLHELITSVPSMRDRMVEGLIGLVQSLQQDFSDEDKFFCKISNTGRIFSQTFTINTEILKGFVTKGGFDKLLDVFKIPVIPKYYNNEFYLMTACLKSLPSVLLNSVLAKVIEKIKSYYSRLEDLAGLLPSLEDFSNVLENDRKSLLHLLTEGDCYLEIIRVILHSWVGISNNHKEFADLLVKLSHLLKVLIAEQARLLTLKAKAQTCESFNLNFDISVLENQESKSLEENLYFCFQLTIRRVFRLAMKIPNRSRQVSQEEAMLSICNTLGHVFNESMKVMHLQQPLTEQKVYHLCLQMSDIMKVLLYEQGSSPAIVMTFYTQGGIQNFAAFLEELKKISFELASKKDLSFHLVNGLQILWHLSGKFMESLVNGKYLNGNYGQHVIKSLGIENSKEIMKKMQLEVLMILEKVNFLESGKVSNYFAKSVIEIFKVLSNLTKEKPVVDPKSVKALVDMGFGAGVSRQALISIGSNSIELAMEWIFNHPEVADLNIQVEPEAPVPSAINNLHLKLVNALAFIPSLYSSVSDLLCKIALTNENEQDEIGLTLLFLIGKLADELLQESDLKEITTGMAELEDETFDPSFEQLNAAIQVLQSLCVRIPEILVIVKGNAFLIHATNFMKKASFDNLQKPWVTSLFSIIDVLVKSGETTNVEIIYPIIEILSVFRSNPEKLKFSESEFLSLVNLLNTLTFNEVLAKEFLSMNGLKLLLLAPVSRSETLNKSLQSSWNSLIKQLCEDPFILQSSFEMSLLAAAEKKPAFDHFFKGFKTEIERSSFIFAKAFENACVVVRRQTVVVEKKKDRQEILGERWNVVKTLAEVLCEVFQVEQNSPAGLYTTCEKLVNVLADVLQAYPRLIGDFVQVVLPCHDFSSGVEQSRAVLSHLIRNVIPFKFSPKLEKDKLTFKHPHSNNSVRSDVYQNWIKSSVRLLRVCLLKQTFKNPDSPLSETYNSVFLDGNSGVLSARKVVVKEFKGILAEQLKKTWFQDEKALTLVRCTSTLLMQILRDPPKLPFVPSGSVELARLFLNEKYGIPKYLSESVRGVDLAFKKASSVLNLLLAPLELLTKYSLNFALKSYKPSEYSEGPIEVFHESSHSESEEQAEDDEEEIEDSEEVSSESQGNQDHLQDIVIESWNTEQFWADDLEEEEQEFPRRAENRNLHMIMAERALLEQDNVQPFLNYRSIFRDLEENLPSGIMWNEFESDDLLQMLLHRNRIPQREENIPEPVFPRSFPESNENLLQLSAYYSGLAIDEALLIEEVKEELQPRLEEEKVEAHLLENLENAENLEENPQNLEENPQNLEENPQNLEENPQNLEENPQNIQSPPRNYALPEGIDPAILEELPEDIRNEVLSQYQRPPREEGVNLEFLQAMPADIRNELLMQQRAPPRPAQDVDNATFIATLTPELRREVLLGASEEFLNTLPPDLVAEARALQDRYVGRDYLQGRQQAIRKKQVQEEDKTISTISNEEKLAASLPVIDDAFLEFLLRILYLSTPVNRDILNSLLVDLSVQPVNRSKILDSLISLLLVNESKGQLPPGHLFGSESYLENFNKVFAITSIRILDVLHHLASSNSRVSQELVNVCKFRLSHIKSIKAEETFGFQDLISLMDHSLFRTSTSHLTPLISLLYSVVQKLDNRIPSLNQVTVDRICSLLSFESLNETTVKSVVEIVTKLSATDINKEQVVQALKNQLVLIAREVFALLEELKTSSNGLKEIQLLRICKVITGVHPLSDEIDFLWGPLSGFLSHIIGQESQLASTTNPLLTRVLPLIECLLIAHYNRTSSPTFERFTEEHSKLLNLIIRQNPNLLYETFSSLVTKYPYLLDFENKRVYFKTELRNLRRDRGYESISLRVRRHEVFMDSFHQLKNKTPAEMHGKLRVTIAGEEGLDAGGVTREWYCLLAREMFNVDYALFKLSANGVSFQPNPNSSINSEHIQFFKFVGRIIGKSLCDSQALDVYFTRSFYKHILGQEVTYQDMEDLDVEFYKSLKFLMEINLDESDLHEYYFSYEEEEFGTLKVKELLPNGKTRRVTEADKMDYIKLLCAAKMTKNIQAQIEAFKSGFHELIPGKIVSIFDSKELELLISGLPTVDLEDLKANTEYHNFTKDSEVIRWFWEVLEGFSREERAEFIQFVTGSSKVPIEGFKALPGIGGFQKFQIHKSFASTDRLPTAHTCMNQLDLPEYPTKEHLRHLLKLAITEGKEGFGFV